MHREPGPQDVETDRPAPAFAPLVALASTIADQILSHRARRVRRRNRAPLRRPEQVDPRSAPGAGIGGGLLS